MFKIRIILLCLFAYLFTPNNSFAKGSKYKLSFHVQGIKNTVCYMGCYYGDKEYIQDTAKVNAKGDFEFSGNDELPGGVYFIMLKNKKYFEFVIDKEQKFKMSTDTANLISFMKISGSEENTLFYQYLNYVIKQHTLMEKDIKGDNKAQADSVNLQVKRYKDAFINKHPNMFMAEVFTAAKDPVIPPSPKLPNGQTDSTFPYRYYKAHFFDNVNFSDGRLVRSPVLYPRVKEYLTKLTAQTPDSIIAAADYLVSKAKANKEMFKFMVAYITSTEQTSNIMGMDAVFVHMADKYYTPALAYWVSASQLEEIKEKAAQLTPILIGKICPEIVLPDTSNTMQALDSVSAQYTVLYFWDYDCGYCQKETPKLIKWYDSIKGQTINVKVYAIQLNENKISQWKDYVKKHDLDWINVADIFHTGNVHQKFAIVSTPIIYVLDENKKILAKNIELGEINKVMMHDLEMKDMAKQKNK